MTKVQLSGLAILTALVYLSFSSGSIPFGASGAPGDIGSCGQTGCHASGNGAFDISGAMTLIDPDGMETTRFAPGVDYSVSIKYEASGLPAGFGFQMVCLDDANEPINAFKDLPTGVQENNLQGKQYLSHTQTLPVTDLEIPWTAPNVPMVNCFIAINAVDGSGSPAGDRDTTFTTMFTRGGTSTYQIEDDLFNVYPNPAHDRLYISGDGNLSSVELMDLNGRRLISQSRNTLDISKLNSGAYLLRLTDANGNMQTEKLLKI